MIQFDVITIFPKIFDSYINESILGRAQKKKLIKIKAHDLRDYSPAKNKIHKTVDDKPYGGGPGMILLIEPLYKALRALANGKSQVANSKSQIANSKWQMANSKSQVANGKWQMANGKRRIILLTPAGKKFTQRDAERLSKYDQIILLSGRYEGFDARVDKLVDEKISIGDYVLAGGELPAMVVIEAVARNISGVVGHAHALDDETFSSPSAKTSADKHGLDYIEAPQYSRPEKIKMQMANGKWQVLKVPKVLLSGDHKKIADWRKKNSKKQK